MTQYARVKAVLQKARKPLALHEIRERILRQFKHMDAETAISARIRDIRRDLELEGQTVMSRRAGIGKAHHLYFLSSIN